MKISEIKDCKKILVVGNDGSGKTYFARQLSEKLGLPLVHLDKEYFRKGWGILPREEWLNRHRQLLEEDEWIIDGYYPHTLKERFLCADAVVYLDVPNLLCYRHLLKRNKEYKTTSRPDLPEKCPEFLRPEQFRAIRTFNKTERNRVYSYMKRYPRKFMFVLHSDYEAEDFLDELDAEE
ncbi:MAG: hypothetical protein IJU96_03150 [Clostridia bacterium]|nr:hypothetical protein [Clostridia bacterium]